MPSDNDNRQSRGQARWWSEANEHTDATKCPIAAVLVSQLRRITLARFLAGEHVNREI